MDQVEKIRRKQKDDPGSQSVKTGKEKPKMRFKDVLKFDKLTREQLIEAVEKEARRLAERDGISLAKAEDMVWKANGSEAQEANDRIRGKPQTEKATTRITPSEVEPDTRARRMMKKDPNLT